jgi:mitofilin
MSTQRSVARPILGIVGGVTLCVGGTAYVATKNETVRKLWVENVPNGVEILEIVTKSEQWILSVDVNELTQKASKTVQETGDRLEKVKQRSTEQYESLSKNVAELKSTVETGFDRTMQGIHDTTRVVTNTVDTVTSTVKENVNKGTEVVMSTAKNVQDGYHRAEETVRSIYTTVEDQIDNVKSMVTGEPKKVKNIKIEPKKVEDVKETRIASNISVAPAQKDVVQKEIEVSNNTDKGMEGNEQPVGKADDVVISVPVAMDTEPAKLAMEETVKQEDVKKEETKEEIIVLEPVVESVPVDSVTLPSDEALLSALIQEPMDIPVESKVIEKVIPKKVGLPSDQPMIPALMSAMMDLSLKLMNLAQQEGTINQKELIDSAQHLAGLAEFLEYLKAEEISMLALALNDQAEGFQRELLDCKAEAEQQISDTQARLTNSFANQIAEEKMKVQKENEELLVIKLQEQSSKFQNALENALKEQSEHLEKFWSTEVKRRVDSERKGRLARLDHLALKLKHLEKIALDANDYVYRSSQIHDLHIALKALKLKLEQRGFINIKAELLKLKVVGKEDPLVATVLKSINPSDVQRLPSIDELHAQFDRLKPILERNQLVPNEAGPLSYLASQLLSYLMLPKRGMVPGTDTLSILSRVEYHLEHKNITDAVLEMNQLKGWCRLLADDWLNSSRLYLTVAQAVEIVETRIGLTSCGYLQ